MKVTLTFLEERQACNEGKLWVTENGLIGLEDIEFLQKLIAYDKLAWANWLIVRVMNRVECCSYTIFAAKQVLDIYEKRYPSDNRPRKAIDAAKILLDAKEAYAAAKEAYATMQKKDSGVWDKSFRKEVNMKDNFSYPVKMENCESQEFENCVHCIFYDNCERKDLLRPYDVVGVAVACLLATIMLCAILDVIGVI